jgi:hypothetical protein
MQMRATVTRGMRRPGQYEVAALYMCAEVWAVSRPYKGMGSVNTFNIFNAEAMMSTPFSNGPQAIACSSPVCGSQTIRYADA